MNIEFKQLLDINSTDIINLMNHPDVKRLMPLIKGRFSKTDYQNFIANKAQLWKDYGYGPWAFVVDDQFAGWGGIQPDEGEVDLALVLHPDFWGLGIRIYKEIIKRAFKIMNVESVVVLFPPARTRIKGLLRLGFKKDNEIHIGDDVFVRYRLINPNHT